VQSAHVLLAGRQNRALATLGAHALIAQRQACACTAPFSRRATRASGHGRPTPVTRLDAPRAIACLLAALVPPLALAACSPRVPMPDAAATPDVVIAVYLQALAADDCDTVRALTAGGGHGLCGELDVVRYAPPERWVAPDGSIGFLTTLTITGGDGSFAQGDNLWTYWLARQPDGSWRIVNEGMG
jgi:hypothetical protein